MSLLSKRTRKHLE